MIFIISILKFDNKNNYFMDNTCRYFNSKLLLKINENNKIGNIILFLICIYFLYIGIYWYILVYILYVYIPFSYMYILVSSFPFCSLSFLVKDIYAFKETLEKIGRSRGIFKFSRQVCYCFSVTCIRITARGLTMHWLYKRH